MDQNNLNTSRRLPSWVHSRLLKAALSLGLLALLLFRLNLQELSENLRNVLPGLLALAVLLLFVAQLVNVFKWRLILRAQGVDTSYFYLFTLFFIGLFFNNFLPSSFGGDIVKAYKLSRTTGRTVEAASSVAMDRATSTLAMLVIAAVAAIFELRLLDTRTVAVILVMLAMVLGSFFLIFSERTARRLGGVLSWDPMGMRRHLVSFYYSLHRLQKKRGAIATVIAISLIYQGLSFIMIYMIALSLDIHLPVFYFFLFIPVIIAVSMIPISLNGLGVREGAWVILFGQVGVASSQAFSMSILSYLALTLLSLLGGVFYLFDRAVPTPEIEAPDETGQ